MATKNDVTGDNIKTKPSSDKFREGFDKIKWTKDSTKETKKEKKDAK